MIFKPILIEKILSGEKTVTRRPIDGRTHPSFGCRYKVGQVYAIQPGMARPSVAKIRVLDVRREKLDDLDNIDAAKEGFATMGGRDQSMRDAFVDYWIALYGCWVENAPVWRIEFELVEVVARVCPQCSGRGVTGIGKKHGAYPVAAHRMVGASG